MNILLSAYACEPNKGSEPGVGWDWAYEISKKHKVWILTRDNNEENINKYLNNNPKMKNDNLNFVYIGLPKWLTFWKKGRRGMRIFYFLWQKKAIKVASKLHEKNKFDLVHHLTFVSYTQPTYMYKLGIPFIWGPIGGADNIPKELKIDMTFKELILERVRKISQKIILFMPFTKNALKYSNLILATTESTKQALPLKYHNKIKIMPAIGVNKVEQKNIIKQNKKFKIIMAGRMVYLKGFDLGITAFIKIANSCPDAELYILGDGPQKEKLKNISGDYLNNRIFFVESIPHDEIFDFYKDFDLYICMALRDSGCMTMLEAMSVGIPALCLASGGPEVLSRGIPYLQIKPDCNDKVINELAKKINELYSDREKVIELSNQTYNVCRDFLTPLKAKKIEEEYYKVVR